MSRALLALLSLNLTYLRLSLVPTLCLLVPLLLLLVQLQFYYGYDGLVVGDHAVVKVRIDETAMPTSNRGAPSISLDAPLGLRVETPFVWIATEREAAWRIGAEEAGEYQLMVTLDGKSVTKHVRVSHDIGWRAPERLKRRFLNEVMYPVEPPIAVDVRIASIHVKYPERQVTVLGWSTHWMIAFFVLSLVFALVLRRPIQVVF
jgi:hypothetical protein